MKKKHLLNLMMILAIVIIAAAGILTAGSILGWFDRAAEDTAELSQIRGIVTLQRDGIACKASAGTVLRKGDRIETGTGAEAEVQVGGSRIALGEKTELLIGNPLTGQFSAAAGKGEIFVVGNTPLDFSFEAGDIRIADAAVSVSIRTDTRSISVYSGNVSWKETVIEAGQTLSIAGDKEKIVPCRESSLNDFLIRQLRSVPGETALCFTAADLDRLMRERKEAMGQAPAAHTEPSEEPEETSEPVLEKETVPGKTEEITEPSETAPETTEAAEETTAAAAPTETAAVTEPAETSAEMEPPSVTEPETTEEAAPQYTCTVTVRCDTILDHMDRLDPGKAEFVPENGMILWDVETAFEEGETAFDVLKRACNQYNVPLEYSWTPMYDSYYIEGINCIYEFDCGSESGWVFRINGWFPNYGCSEHILKDGDRVEFCYTCTGLGSDVGGGVG